MDLSSEAVFSFVAKDEVVVNVEIAKFEVHGRGVALGLVATRNEGNLDGDSTSR